MTYYETKIGKIIEEEFDSRMGMQLFLISWTKV